MRTFLLTSLTLVLLQTAPASSLSLVADTEITAAMVRDAAGDRTDVEIEVLLPSGADPHHTHLSPSRIRALSRADRVIMVGPNLTPWLPQVLSRADVPEERILSLLDLPGQIERGFSHGGADTHDHGHGHGHDDDHAEDADMGHAPDQIAQDPHAWLDPGNGVVWVLGIGEALAEADPVNAEIYRANARAAGDRYRQAGADMVALLQPFQGAGIAVLHDAYAHLAEPLGLRVTASLSAGDAARPGVRRLREVHARLTHDDTACLFQEAHAPATLAEEVARDAGLRLGRLDPLGTRQEPGADFYPRLLRALAEDLAACLGAAR